MISLKEGNYLLSTCYVMSIELQASIAWISLNLHNNPTREASSSAPLPHFIDEEIKTQWG